MKTRLTTGLLSFLVFLTLPSITHAQQDSFYVGDISITGNKITKRSVILREILFRKGEKIEKSSLQERLIQSKNQLVKTSLFNIVELLPDSIGDTLSIHIRVKERWYIIPDPKFELADRNFNAWLETKDIYRTTFGTELLFNNFRGRNEKLNLALIFGWRTQLGLSYLIPYINRQKTLGLRVAYFYEQGHEIGLKTDRNKLRYFRFYPDLLTVSHTATLSFIYRKKYFLTHTAGLLLSLNKVADTVSRLNPQYLGNANDRLLYGGLEYQITYDKRDAVTYPLEGYLLSGMMEYITGLYVGNTLRLPILYFKIHHFQPLPWHFNYATGLTGRISPGEKYPYILQNSFGYDDYVRGYEHYVVNGQSYFLIRNELRNQVFSHTFHLAFIPFQQLNSIPIQLFFKIFLDDGYVSNFFPEGENTLQNTWLNGFGLGIDVVSYYDKALRLEYSFNGLGQRELFLHYNEAF